jgi:hypothetical protein
MKSLSAQCLPLRSLSFAPLISSSALCPLVHFPCSPPLPSLQPCELSIQLLNSLREILKASCQESLDCPMSENSWCHQVS